MKLEYSPKTFSNLRLFNLAMFFVHLLQAIVMVLISNNSSAKLYTEFLKFDVSSNSIDTVQEQVTSIPLGYSVAAFLFISALAHLIIATVYNKKYNTDLAKGANFARWVEYSFSSSLMIVVIAILVGMYDAPSLVLTFFLNMTMILFGYVMELHNISTQKTDWTSFIFGCISGIVPWIVMGWYFFGAVSKTNEVNPVPDFVYGIFFSLFAFFNIFAVNMFLQYKKIGPWKNYLFGEIVYILLSLFAKSLLAWQVWSGTLR